MSEAYKCPICGAALVPGPVAGWKCVAEGCPVELFPWDASTLEIAAATRAREIGDALIAAVKRVRADAAQEGSN